MAEENISQEIRLKNIGETNKFFLEEIMKNKTVIKKHKKVSASRNYIGHFLILASRITWCITISDFSSLIGILIGIKSNKSIIKKKKNEHDKIILLVKSNSIEFWISKALIDAVISHDEFVIINNVRK